MSADLETGLFSYGFFGSRKCFFRYSSLVEINNVYTLSQILKNWPPMGGMTWSSNFILVRFHIFLMIPLSSSLACSKFPEHHRHKRRETQTTRTVKEAGEVGFNRRRTPRSGQRSEFSFWTESDRAVESFGPFSASVMWFCFSFGRILKLRRRRLEQHSSVSF